MKPERDPADVITRILALVPDTFASMRIQLDSIARDSRYLPPEYKQPAWLRLRDVLTEHLPRDPSTGPDWVQRIANIVQGKED